MKKALLFVAFCFLVLGSTAAHALVVGSTVQIVSRGLVGHWTMDGKNVNWVTGLVKDSSSSGNTGTMQGLISTSTSPRAGKLGQAITLDGVNDFVSVGQDLGFRGDVAVSVSAWMYLTGANSGNFPAVVDFQSQTGSCTGLYFTIQSNRPSIDFGGNRWRATSALAQGRWYHVVVTKSPGAISATSKIYVNGEEVSGAVEIGDCTPDVAAPAAGGLVIGRLTHTGAYVAGSLDDVRIYNRALSLAEIKLLYGQTAGSKAASTISPGTTSSGLAAHWTFDGKDLISNVVDRSGNGGTGLLKGFVSTTTVAGKIGQALKFDGVDDYVRVPHSASLVGTQVSVSLWMRPNVTYDASSAIVALLDKTTSGSTDYVINLRGSGGTGEVEFVAGVNGGLTRVSSATVSWKKNQWYHITGVYNGSTMKVYVNGAEDGSTNAAGSITTGTDALIIGAVSLENGRFFNGTIDDVRVYTRALTASEVALLYKQAAPVKMGVTSSPGGLSSGLVGHWTMDGKHINWDTQKATDASGSGNTGTITNMSTTSSPVAGKIGQAIRYTKADDSFSVADADSLDLTTDGTFTAWIRPTAFTNNSIISRGNNGYNLYIQDTGKVAFGKTGADELLSNGTLRLNAWNHIAGTRTGGTNTIYINGVADNSGTKADWNVLTTSISIAGNGYTGSLDDVRIYNRALSAAEITQLYKNGR